MPTRFLSPFLTLLRMALAVLVFSAPVAHAQSLFEALGKALQGQSPAEEEKPVPEAAVPAGRNLTREPGGKRLALVIGNDAYQRISKLEKAGNDATTMARELKAAGFDVRRL